MADTVTSQTLQDRSDEIVVHLTNDSDGTGETKVLKVDVSALNGAPAEVAITKVVFSTYGMAVKLYWDATTDTLALALPSDHCGEMDFGRQGIRNSAGSGKTGDILLSTIGHSAGDAYSITLYMRRAG